MQTCLKSAHAVAVQIVSVRMKTIWLLALLAVSAQAQNVFLLGSNTTPPPDLNGYAAPTQVAAAPACAYPVYDPYYPQVYSPNVTYICGPGTRGPNYYNYPRYNSGQVIYFGGLQAYRQGYNFRH